MIIPTFISIPVAGVPSAGMLQKAVEGGIGSESGIAFNSMSGLDGLGYDPGYDPEPDPGYGGGTTDPSVYFDSPGFNIDTSSIGSTLATGPEQQAAYAALQAEFTSQGLPAPSASNVRVVGSAGQSSSAWQQAMTLALIKSGGQIMQNVTMPAGMLAVRNANGSTTYYRQPEGSRQNLNVGGGYGGGYGGAGGVGVNMPGVMGGISTGMVMALTAAAGFAFIYMQQRGR
jgi:hypothetical protein